MRVKKYVVVIIFLTFVVAMPVNLAVFLIYVKKNAAIDKEKLIKNIESIEQVCKAEITDGLPKFIDYKCPCLCDVNVITRDNMRVSFFDIDSDLKFFSKGGFTSLTIPNTKKHIKIFTIEKDAFKKYRTISTYTDAKIFEYSSGIKCSSVYDFFENYNAIIEYAKYIPEQNDITDSYFKEYSIRIGSSRYLLVRD